MTATPPPRLTSRERARHRANLAVTGLLFSLTCFALVGFAVLAVIGNLLENDSTPTDTPSPSQTVPGTPIRWLYGGATCADGWGSPSIGQPGACSHHGGVVTIYTSRPGGLHTRCENAAYRPRTLEDAQELADDTGWVDCTITPYGDTSPAPSVG